MKKIRVVLAITATVLVMAPAFAADQSVSLREDAPIYTGLVQEGDLEELTLEDFQAFGVEPQDPEDQYRQYRKVLDEATPETQVLYKMRIVDRDLAPDDFLGFNVSAELAQARYDAYLTMEPVTVDGRTVHYVYVYHRFLVRGT